MFSQKSIDPQNSGLVKLGGVAFVLTALAYLVCLVLTRFIPPAGGSVESYLAASAGRIGVVSTLWVAYIVSDVLLVPALMGLYFVLRRGGQSAVLLIGTALVGGYLVFDIAITEPNWLALASLANGYAAASPADQASYIGAARYGLALVPFVNALSFFVSGLGFLLISIVMLRSPFRRSTVIFGMAVMALSMVAGLSWFVTPLQVVINVVLSGFSLWCVVVGAQMYRFGSRAAAVERQESTDSGVPRAAAPRALS